MSDATVPLRLYFESDAADADWVVASATLREALNEPYALELRLETDALDSEPGLLLGQSAHLRVEREAVVRKLTGIVSEVNEGVDVDHAMFVRIVVRPALEALRHRVNTRIFQDMTVPDILEEVLVEGLGAFGRDVDNRLQRTYPSCEYRVQYDETDLAFCQRLMEQEGIIYWFEFEGEEETLVLADAPSEYEVVESVHGAILEFHPRDFDGQERHEYIRAFSADSRMVSTSLVTRHFDWTHPSVPIEAESADKSPAERRSGAHIQPTREIYEHDSRPLTLHEYGGTYGAQDAEAQILLRREAQVWPAHVVRGSSSVAAMRPGATFEVSGHPAPEYDRKFVTLSVVHHFDGSAGPYHNELHCIPDDAVYRPRRRTASPQIDSTLTATVTGPAGEEIHVDEHGRIKVQFHWDRLGKSDDRSSCWIRVMQPWAGAGWGFMFTPRIGMEVMVDFVHGEPDRPLVIGAVYNGAHPVPYELPSDKTKSTIKSESSLGGGGFNELRFEDLAGSEEVFLHAQKDLNEVVENDHTTTVHHDQTIRVDNDQEQEVGNNQTEHVFVDQDLTVDANRTVTVHGDFTETIDGSETRTVSTGVTETIDAGETRTVTGSMTETITGGRTQTINASSTESIGGSLTQDITGGVTIVTPATYEVTATAGFSITTPAAVTVIAPGGYTLMAPGGQTTVDNSWLAMGNCWFDNYGMKANLTVTKFVCTYVLHLLIMNYHLDVTLGAKLVTGAGWEQFTGCKAKYSAAKFKSITLGLITAGLYNKT